MKWKKQDKNLVKGDIIRCKVGNKNNPRYGEYVYSICSGVGNGCSTSTMGSAIFIHHQSFDLEEVRSKKFLDPELKSSAGGNRWERFWRIEYLVE